MKSINNADTPIADEPADISILRVGSQASVKPSAEFFTGDVRLDSLFKGTGDARISGAVVTFEPAARTAWHTHPLGQTLVVSAGFGCVQQWGKAIEPMRPGDIVWIPAGVKHWHGASATVAMTHLAIAEQQGGNVVQWLEKVSDEQYLGQ